MAIWFTNRLKFEFSDGLKGLDAPSWYDRGSRRVGVRRLPISFGLSIGIPDRENDDVPLAVVNDRLWGLTNV